MDNGLRRRGFYQRRQSIYRYGKRYREVGCSKCSKFASGRSFEADARRSAEKHRSTRQSVSAAKRTGKIQYRPGQAPHAREKRPFVKLVSSQLTSTITARRSLCLTQQILSNYFMG